MLITETKGGNMLQNLHLKNLALIDETEVEFKDGLNILSGETGAGKSILIGSINLALGEKVPKELLRDNDKPALVELVFFVENPAVREAVEAMDIDMEDDTVILSRKITSGRALARINGEAVSVSKMKAVASLLIDIHGQHENQSLLSPKKHLELLDEFAAGQLGDKKEQMKACYLDYKKIKEELEDTSMDTKERAKELSFLEYEVKEIEDAHLTAGEDEELEKLFRRFLNGKKIMDAVEIASAAVAGEGENASELVGKALKELSSVASYDERVAEMEKQLSEIDALLGDFNHELFSYLSDSEFDDETYYKTEQRLDLINHLKSRYGSTIPEILKAYGEKTDRIGILNDYDHYLDELSEKLNKKKKELDKLCAEVSGIRKKAGEELAKAVSSALVDLNFLDVSFAADFKEIPYSANGTDEVEFLISTNPGEPLKPLAKIASGGELSRIALAIKTVMAADTVGTLIFDEIDSGISGRTAQMVSEKMALLAKDHQIISITHLPQIAAMADAHFLIEKSVKEQSTVSKIHLLKEEESVKELARMLGGVEITDTVLKSAREMKTMAHMKK